MPTLNLIQTRGAIAARLRAAGLDDPLREASYVLAAALGITRGEMLALDELDITDDQAARLATFALRREAREPLARLVGEKEFWGLRFKLNDHTLVPRPETETLVEAVLRQLPNRTAHYRILDLGTGTGCILLALLHELPNATGVGVDLAPEAVQQATENAAALGLGTRTTFIVSDWLQQVEGEFDIVVSNPPYIAPDEREGLMAEVRDHDPALALFAEEEGLAAYRALIPAACARLKDGGVLALEVGAAQAESVEKIVQAANKPFLTHAINDLGGIGRVIVACASHEPPAS